MANELEIGVGGPPAPLPDVRKGEPEGSPATGTSPMSDMGQHFQTGLEGAQARFNKLKDASKLLTATRKQLDHLTSLGDMVAEEDLLEAASQLVGDGASATGVAGLLADAPQGAEALQSWIAERDQAVQQQEAQMEQVMGLARHQLALAGLRKLIGHAAEEHQMRAEGNL